MTNIEIQVNAVEPLRRGPDVRRGGSLSAHPGRRQGRARPGGAAEQRSSSTSTRRRGTHGAWSNTRPISSYCGRRDPSRTNGVLVYDVTNRGSKRIFQRLDDAPGDPPAAANDLKTAREAGIGFLLGRGYSLVWSGWDPGAPSANNGLGARFPTAMENGRPITGHIRHEFHIGTRAPGKGDLVRLPYPAVSTDKQRTRLTVRDREGDTRTEIPAASWEFADTQSIRLLPPGSLFAPFKIYELWYEATGSKVLGIGFASVRDLVSFLRYETLRSQRHAEPDDRRRRARQRNGHPPRARFRRLAERALSAPFPRARHERRRARAAGLRRRDEPCRGRRQGVRQPPLRHAGTHRDPARGPPLSGELVPVRQRRYDRSVLAQDRGHSPGPSDRPAGHRNQQLDRVLAEGRFAGAHRSDRPQ